MASWLHRVQDGFDTVMTALESSLHWRPSALPRDGSAESKEEPSLPEPAAILAPESDSLPPPSFNLLSVPLIRTVSGMPLCKVCRVPAGCCAHTDLELVEERRGLQLEDASSSCSSSSSSSVTMSRVDSDSAGQETLRRRGSDVSKLFVYTQKPIHTIEFEELKAFSRRSRSPSESGEDENVTDGTESQKQKQGRREEQKGRRKRRLEDVSVDASDGSKSIHDPRKRRKTDRGGVTGAGAELHVFCDHCQENHQGRITLHCPDCENLLDFEAETLMRRTEEKDDDDDDAGRAWGSWDEFLKHWNLRNFCHSCNNNVRGVLVPLCGSCGKISVPLLQLQRNPREQTCCGCWCDEPEMVVFPCRRAAQTKNTNHASSAEQDEKDGNVETDDFGKNSPEDHFQCLDCFRQYARLAVSERRLMFDPQALSFTIQCPMGCRGSCIDSQMLRLLGSAEFQKYRRFSALNYGESTVVWCPNPECSHGMVPTNPSATQQTCPECKESFCPHCEGSGHGGKCGEGGHRAEDVSEEERATQALIAQLTKPCPGCGVRIMKQQGCNHMTCSRCLLQFCWIHQRKWSEECQKDHWFDSRLLTRAMNLRENLSAGEEMDISSAQSASSASGVEAEQARCTIL